LLDWTPLYCTWWQTHITIR